MPFFPFAVVLQKYGKRKRHTAFLLKDHMPCGISLHKNSFIDGASAPVPIFPMAMGLLYRLPVSLSIKTSGLLRLLPRLPPEIFL